MNLQLNLSQLHGWIILDKGMGCSSARAVSQIKKLFGASKVGHAGTLDPLATGVLPVALGEATKTVNFIQGSTKTYHFSIHWGEERDTGDAEGVIVGQDNYCPSSEQITKACKLLTGNIMQVPPAYSAIKVRGRRAYELARKGEILSLQPRKVRINRFDLRSTEGREKATFLVECGKGTYIRSLAHDLATNLGALGHVSAIRRERVGRMHIEQAISLEKLTQVVHSAAPREVIYPVETALADIPALPLTGDQAQRLRNGQAIRVNSVEKGTVCAMLNDGPVAVARIDGDQLHPIRVFNFN